MSLEILVYKEGNFLNAVGEKVNPIPVGEPIVLTSLPRDFTFLSAREQKEIFEIELDKELKYIFSITSQDSLVGPKEKEFLKEANAYCTNSKFNFLTGEIKVKAVQLYKI